MEAIVGSSGRPLVLLVDPEVGSRHWLWRRLSSAFGLLEAPNAVLARQWIAERPDIDALIVDQDLPDSRGTELVDSLARDRHPLAQRSIVLARSPEDWRVAWPGLTLVERGDVRAIVSKLTSWLRTKDIAQALALLEQLRRSPDSSRSARR